MLLGTYGYDYWRLASLAKSVSLFEEAYGDLITRSKLSFDPMLESWSKTGTRFKLPSQFSFDMFLDAEFRRANTGEPEDNYQCLGPGLRLNFNYSRVFAAVSAHQELGSYTFKSESVSRWKTLLVISGAL